MQKVLEKHQDEYDEFVVKKQDLLVGSALLTHFKHFNFLVLMLRAHLKDTTWQGWSNIESAPLSVFYAYLHACYLHACMMKGCDQVGQADLDVAYSESLHTPTLVVYVHQRTYVFACGWNADGAAANEGGPGGIGGTITVSSLLTGWACLGFVRQNWG